MVSLFCQALCLAVFLSRWTPAKLLVPGKILIYIGMAVACEDVLPLPLFDVRKCLSHGLSRGTVQRARQNEAVFKRCNGVLGALNDLDNYRGSKRSSLLVSDAQRAALRNVVEAVKNFKPPTGLMTPKEAATELLRTDVGYGADEPTTVESFCASKISLPVGQSSPVPLNSVLGNSDRDLLDNFHDSVLLDAENFC